MALHTLTARAVETADDGDHNDGGELVLRVRGTRANWVFRFTSPSGRRRGAGFGAAHRGTTKTAGESLRLALARTSHLRQLNWARPRTSYGRNGSKRARVR